MKIITVNVFSAGNGGGNPCALVDNATSLNKKEMQDIATKINFPETIFIIQHQEEYILRFFATKGELPMCCHGTLGAAYYLLRLHPTNKLNIKAYSNNVPLDVNCVDDQVSMSLAGGKILQQDIDLFTVSKMLNIDESLIDKNLPCAVASAGSPKLLVPVISKNTLFNIIPHVDLIMEWCKANKFNGLYVYSKDTLNPEADFVARSFNPLFSHQEDVATGIAAAALGHLLFIKTEPKESYTIEQGYNINRPSQIRVTLGQGKIRIYGRAFFTESNISL